MKYNVCEKHIADFDVGEEKLIVRTLDPTEMVNCDYCSSIPSHAKYTLIEQ